MAFAVLASAESQATVVIPQASAAAIAMHHDLPYFWIADHMIALGLPFALLFSGYGTRIARTCERITHGRWFWTAVLFASLYMLLLAILSLPIQFVRFHRLPAWGWAGPDHSLLRWSLRQSTDILRQALIGAALGWIPFWIVRLSPRRWWLCTAIVASTVIVGLLFVRPIWIDQSVASLGPLQDPAWQKRIDQLGERVGLDHVSVLIKPAIKGDTCGNAIATVEGIGFTRRMILSEKYVQTHPQREAIAIIAHELKHYRFDATWKPIVMVVCFAFAATLTVALLIRIALRRWSAVFRFSALSDPASLPLLVLATYLYLLAAVPAFNLLSQHIEHEADRFALEMTRDNEAVACEVVDVCFPVYPEDSWFDRLYLHNHLSLGERVRFAQSYRPWERGERLVYGQ